MDIEDTVFLQVLCQLQIDGPTMRKLTIPFKRAHAGGPLSSGFYNHFLMIQEGYQTEELLIKVTMNNFFIGMDMLHFLTSQVYLKKTDPIIE